MRIEDLPQEVMDTVMGGLQHYMIPILALPAQEEKASPDSHPIGGTGTLVKIDRAHYILTAAHVWHLVRKFKHMLLGLNDQPFAFTIPPERLNPKVLSDTFSPEWGPDLALLEIAHDDDEKISAYKNFLDLSRQRHEFGEHPSNIETGLWAVTGMVHAFSAIEHDHEAKSQ